MSRTSLRRTLPLSLLLALLVALTAAGCGSDETANGSAVDVETFQARVDQPDVVVLDVRTPEEYAAGHLPDAVNVDVQSPDFATEIATLDRDAAYAVYCQSGNRSGVAAEEMVATGFTDVAHLDGGIVDWQSAGGEIVTD